MEQKPLKTSLLSEYSRKLVSNDIPYESPILGQLLDLISPAKINLFEPRFEFYDPWDMASCFFFKDFKILLEIRMDQVIIGKVDRNSVIISSKDRGKRDSPFFNGCGGLILEWLNLRMCKFYNMSHDCSKRSVVV